MSNIVISGYYGSKNAGDEAMLAAMIEVLSDIDPKIRITVISANPSDTQKRHGVASVSWLNLFDIAKAMMRADLLLSGGGSLLQNVTSGRSLYYYMGILFLAKCLGTPVMLYAQGIGPIYGAFARRMMQFVGNMANLITVRDSGSLGELERLHIHKPPIHVTADPVLAIHPVDKEMGRAVLKSYGASGAKPLVGISVREWRCWTHYKDIIAQAADQIVEEFDARVVFLPMQYPEDVAAAETIALRTKEKSIVLNDEYTTSELLSIVGNLDLLIGIRLHALIFAGVMGVPMIGMSYDPKIDRFLQSIGEDVVGDLENVTVDTLMVRVRKKWNDKAIFRKMNAQLLSGLRDAASKNAELAMELIGNNKAVKRFREMKNE
ncbi:polysaccharide pyruvyl transferase CsaB [Propionispira raffinosivorans]|uniref:polysaccharide pyruvyl transferase CsaB n=1 Tax=Propionispira raffinosivorans TaxID=86959 RepID=UPI0003797EAB|nr:polysaccharide pyruvyl transferase CsaB [Propionispira raffinosivorans]